MALLEKVLQKLWPNLSAHWVNVDSFGPDIGGQILQLRMRHENIDPTPIILYGFSPFESLVRSEKAQPGLLVSPGVYHLHLPANWDRVKSILKRAQETRIDRKKLKSTLMNDALAGGRLARMESELAHHMGNFLGPEKLLYGAHLAEMIDHEIFQKILAKIRDKQKTILESRKEYYLYRLSQVNYTPNWVNKISEPKVTRGEILYIDDHAHLGWAFAVAAALFGKFRCFFSVKKAKEYNMDIFASYFENGPSLCVINTEGISATENAYMDKALAIANDHTFIQRFSLILVDLRLRWKQDENQNIKDISGMKVIRKIRDANAAIPVVVLTASRKAKNMERVLELGADGYFIKELPQPNEKQDEIEDYYHRFVQVVKEAIDKSYLAEAWRIVKKLELYESKDYINSRMDYNELPDDFKIDWQQQVISPLKKGIGFMRKENTSFEQDAFQLSTIAEAIINFNHPNDTFKTLNDNYKDRYKNEVDPPIRIYLNPNPYLFNGHLLLAGLRNLAAHGKHEKIFEKNDGEIAMYLGFRALIGKKHTDAVNLLKKLITKIFPQHKNQRIDLETVKNEATNRREQAETDKDRLYLEFLADINTEEGKKPLEQDEILICEICKNHNIPIMPL